MSFDIYVQGFAGGEASSFDAEPLGELLRAHAVLDGIEVVRLAFDDGEAEVYGADEPETGFMVTHASGRLVWDFLAEVAVRCGAAILLPDGPAMVGSPAALSGLPEELASDAVVVTTGAEMLAVVAGS